MEEPLSSGGVSAILMGVLFLVAIALLPITPQARALAVATLQYIASNRSIYIVNQLLGIAPVFLGIIALLALYMALKHLNKSYAAIGALVATSPKFSLWPI